MRDPLFWLPIKYKLPLTIALVYFVAFGVGGYLVSSSTEKVLKSEIQDGLESKAFFLTDIIGRHFDLARRRVEDFASDGFIRLELARFLEASGDRAGESVANARQRLVRHLVENKLPLVPWFLDAALLDADGTPVVVAHAPFAAPLARSPASAEFGPLTPPAAEHPYRTFSISAPVTSLDGERRLGFLQLLVRVDAWIGEVAELQQLRRMRLARLRLADPSGYDFSLLPEAVGPARAAGDGVSASSNLLEYTTTVAPGGWELELAIDRAQLLAPVSTLFQKILSIGALLLGLNLVFLFFPVRFLLRPLLVLRDAAQRIAGGDFSTRVVETGSRDEMNDLSRAFNIMAQAVEERTHRLEEAAQELKKREGQLRFERDRLDTIIRSMQDGLFILNAEGEVTLANAAARHLVDKLGDDLTPKRRLHCTRTEAPKTSCLHCLAESRQFPKSCMVNLGERIYEIHVTPLPSRDVPHSEGVYVSRDVTERVAQSENQAHQERMHVVGELAAVMAHELNNPLAAIAMFAEMLLDALASGSPHREHAEVILRNAKTCKRTIGGLLDMAAFPTPEAAEFDLHDLLVDVGTVLRPFIQRTTCQLRIEPGARDSCLVADELQIRQVIVNLVMNALQAGGGREGRVTVRTATAENDRIVLEVEDNGPGIPEGVREHVFKPFYTTKPAGMGTGLGLPTSKRIVEFHGGTLELVCSEPGNTLFRVTLPREGGRRSWSAKDSYFGNVGALRTSPTTMGSTDGKDS